jgi:hypothetical protein
VTAFDDLAAAREDIDALLVDVLSSVLSEEAEPVEEGLPPGPLAVARLAIHDALEDAYAVVEVRVGLDLSQVLAGEMMHVADPSPDDVLDAVAELGNICGGNVKSLLCQHARLSLPAAEITQQRPEDVGPAVRVRALVLGHVAELGVLPGAPVDGLLWPPSLAEDALERSQ